MEADQEQSQIGPDGQTPTTQFRMQSISQLAKELHLESHNGSTEKVASVMQPSAPEKSKRQSVESSFTMKKDQAIVQDYVSSTIVKKRTKGGGQKKKLTTARGHYHARDAHLNPMAFSALNELL